jgi:acyl-CoA thioesterase-1
MGDGLDIIIYFVGSGLAFFAGAGSILVGLTISPFVHNRPRSLVRNLAVLIGSLFVAISAIPLDWWHYALLATVTILWLPMEWFADAVGKKMLTSARIAIAVVWLITLGLELPFQFAPMLPALGKPTLFLIGDSVSAGMSDQEKDTWPNLLAKAHQIDVRDFSKMGATVGSARKQAERLENRPGLVLLEIGGNDLLGSTTADQYEERLDLLLADVCRHDRTVVMIELPLPPFANRFGTIQRRLARKYQVALIPRRTFISVLTTAGATVDGVHLTRAGHALMAGVIWQAISPAYTGQKD